MALSLYGFLGIAFYVLWQGLRQHEDEIVDLVPSASLAVETGNDAGRQVPLRPVTAVGRAADNSVVLNDPFASAHHTLILWRDNRWWVEDLESHNGTFLNEEKLPQPVPLTSGDRIRIGETVLRFESQEQPVPEAIF